MNYKDLENPMNVLEWEPVYNVDPLKPINASEKYPPLDEVKVGDYIAMNQICDFGALPKMLEANITQAAGYYNLFNELKKSYYPVFSFAPERLEDVLEQGFLGSFPPDNDHLDPNFPGSIGVQPFLEDLDGTPRDIHGKRCYAIVVDQNIIDQIRPIATAISSPSQRFEGVVTPLVPHIPLSSVVIVDGTGEVKFSPLDNSKSISKPPSTKLPALTIGSQIQGVLDKNAEELEIQRVKEDNNAVIDQLRISGVATEKNETLYMLAVAAFEKLKEDLRVIADTEMNKAERIEAVRKALDACGGDIKLREHPLNGNPLTVRLQFGGESLVKRLLRLDTGVSIDFTPAEPKKYSPQTRITLSPSTPNGLNNTRAMEILEAIIPDSDEKKLAKRAS